MAQDLVENPNPAQVVLDEVVVRSERPRNVALRLDREPRDPSLTKLALLDPSYRRPSGSPTKLRLREAALKCVVQEPRQDSLALGTQQDHPLRKSNLGGSKHRHLAKWCFRRYQHVLGSRKSSAHPFVVELGRDVLCGVVEDSAILDHLCRDEANTRSDLRWRLATVVNESLSYLLYRQRLDTQAPTTPFTVSRILVLRSRASVVSRSNSSAKVKKMLAQPSSLAASPGTTPTYRPGFRLPAFRTDVLQRRRLTEAGDVGVGECWSEDLSQLALGNCATESEIRRLATVQPHDIRDELDLPFGPIAMRAIDLTVDVSSIDKQHWLERGRFASFRGRRNHRVHGRVTV